MMENKIFAGIRLRLLATYINLMILGLPTTFLLWYACLSISVPMFAERLFLLFIILIFVFIFVDFLHDVFFTHYFGGTIGKLLTGLRVVDEKGNKLSLKRSFFRHTVGYQFSSILFGLGFLAIIKDPQKQGWHDKAVGSKVIVERKNWPLALIVLLTLLILNMFILFSAFNTAFSGPLPKEFKSFVDSFQAEQEKTKPSTDSKALTANWQIYHNDEFGFEVKYPPLWSENSSGGGATLGENRIDIGIIVWNDGSTEYVENQWKQIDCAPWNDPNGGCSPLYNKEEKKLSLNSYAIYFKIDGRGQMHAYIPNRVKNKTVEIYSVYLTDRKIFDQILSTFRFVE